MLNKILIDLLWSNLTEKYWAFIIDVLTSLHSVRST